MLSFINISGMECVEVVEILWILVTTKKSDKLDICTSINKKLVGLYVSGLNVASSWSSQIFISDSVPKMITMMHSFQMKLLEAEKNVLLMDLYKIIFIH